MGPPEALGYGSVCSLGCGWHLLNNALPGRTLQKHGGVQGDADDDNTRTPVLKLRYWLLVPAIICKLSPFIAKLCTWAVIPFFESSSTRKDLFSWLQERPTTTWDCGPGGNKPCRTIQPNRFRSCAPGN